MVWIADEIMLILYFCPPDEECDPEAQMLKSMLTGEDVELELPSVVLGRFFVNLPIEGDYAVLTRAMRTKAARILLERGYPDVLKSIDGTALLNTIEEEVDASKSSNESPAESNTEHPAKENYYTCARSRSDVSDSKDKDSTQNSPNDTVGGE